MSLKLRRGIKEAAASADAAAAVARLEAVPNWRRDASNHSGELPPKLRHRLLGVCLRGGLIDDALALLGCHPNDRLPRCEAIVLDPQYSGPGGHHHQYCLFYLDLIAEAGMSGVLVHPASRAKRSVEGPGGRALVLPRLPADFRLFPMGVGNAEVQTLNDLYARIFALSLPDWRPRMIVVPTASHMFINGLADYLARTPGDETSLILGLHESYWVDQQQRSTQEPFRLALETLGREASIRTLIIGETPPIADGFRHMIGPPWEVISGPLFTAPAPSEDHPTRRRTDRAVVGYAGRSAVGRGIDILADIVHITLRDDPGLSWSIHVNPRKLPDPEVDALDTALRSAVEAGTVLFRPRRLDSTEYVEMLQTIDIMVLPFSSEYLVRSSGLAPECLRYGIVMVVPEKSTMAAVAEEHGAGYVTFSELSAAAVAEAIGDAVRRLPELQDRSAAATTRVGRSSSLASIQEFMAAA